MRLDYVGRYSKVGSNKESKPELFVHERNGNPVHEDVAACLNLIWDGGKGNGTK